MDLPEHKKAVFSDALDYADGLLEVLVRRLAEYEPVVDSEKHTRLLLKAREFLTEVRREKSCLYPLALPNP